VELAQLNGLGDGRLDVLVRGRCVGRRRRHGVYSLDAGPGHWHGQSDESKAAASAGRTVQAAGETVFGILETKWRQKDWRNSVERRGKAEGVRRARGYCREEGGGGNSTFEDIDSALQCLLSNFLRFFSCTLNLIHRLCRE
jgi:hypothetical protein